MAPTPANLNIDTPENIVDDDDVILIPAIETVDPTGTLILSIGKGGHARRFRVNIAIVRGNSGVLKEKLDSMEGLFVDSLENPRELRLEEGNPHAVASMCYLMHLHFDNEGSFSRYRTPTALSIFRLAQAADRYATVSTIGLVVERFILVFLMKVGQIEFPWMCQLAAAAKLLNLEFAFRQATIRLVSEYKTERYALQANTGWGKVLGDKVLNALGDQRIVHNAQSKKVATRVTGLCLTCVQELVLDLLEPCKHR